MPSDIIAVAIAIALGVFILHVKSHIKFILLGLYIGLVLAETVAQGIYDYLASRWDVLASASGYNFMQLVLLLLPALVMGFNHAKDRQRWSLSKKMTFVIVTSLVMLASILRYLPDGLRQRLIDNSLVVWQIHQLFIAWLIVGAALLIVESFHHKKLVKQNP